MKKFSTSIIFFFVINLYTTYGQSYSTFIDDRDQKTYRTVKIDTLNWMAEDLSFSMNGSFLTPNKNRVYTWYSALIACPVGWHLPTSREWHSLINSLGGRKIAGELLKSTKGWQSGFNGTNKSGFNALPGGIRGMHTLRFTDVDNTVIWWSKDRQDELAHIFKLKKNHKIVSRALPKEYGISVRCIQDQ